MKMELSEYSTSTKIFVVASTYKMFFSLEVTATGPKKKDFTSSTEQQNNTDVNEKNIQLLIQIRTFKDSKNKS